MQMGQERLELLHCFKTSLDKSLKTNGKTCNLLENEV